ncbi:TM2 domain-containing protein [Aeromonas taiwanensis]|uniref:TM2 domain-containing protein n=1 Tax=Aeromonas taiwanensis TaxID=633417 RepID=A0A5F0K778_9GAMM|nr:TM2 domain-containing protein [Aeromonas taiwanensis]TFF72479.1 TM2 domain-containing protein [Aeromonas taiwanensis]TFF73088.1 TM2 domain-containing protein [Aeromonas taiwanensis]TFF75926.1 TM2 domain-containing protein [Aeromonas taiwanensis]
MGSPTITTISDLVLRSHDDYEAVFEHVAAHLQAEGGTIKKADRAKGELEASWKYGINPFGLRVTVHFSSPEEGIVELSLTGSFVDAIDTWGTAKKKAKAIADVLSSAIDAAAWPIREPEQAQSPTQSAPAVGSVHHRGKRKVLMALLVFFGGGFGLHKFYTGNWGWGLIYLAACTTGIPVLLSLIEFIKVLCLSQEEFDKRYNYQAVRAFQWVW